MLADRRVILTVLDNILITHFAAICLGNKAKSYLYTNILLEHGKKNYLDTKKRGKGWVK